LERKLTQQINIYYDLHVPQGYRPDGKYPLLIALHGYEGNKESMMALAKKINKEDWLIASLQGPYQFLIRPKDGEQETGVGFGWVTRYKSQESVALHHRAIFDLIGDVSADYRVDERNIFLLGFSQAVGLNYRFVFTYPDVIRGVVAVCGGIPGDFQEKPYYNTKTEILHIAAEMDQYYPLERSRGFKEALQRRAERVDFKTYPVGHVFPRESLGYIREWISGCVMRNP